MKARVVVVAQNNSCSIEAFGPILRTSELKLISAEDHGELDRELVADNYDVCVVRSDELSEQEFELMQFIRKQNGTAKVIVSVGSASVSEAVRYIKAGAADFVVGDPDGSGLKESIESLFPQRMADHAPADPERVEASEDLVLLGNNGRIQEALAAIMLVARSKTAVMITGESGTGKELVARIIHHKSERVNKPFVALDAGEVPQEQMESELFGHEKGAFEGALASKKGAFELANGGSLFLNRIDEINSEVQGKLLRAIDHQAFRRIGGSEEAAIDVRPLAATEKNIYRAMKEGEFWKDLYYRFSPIEIYLPPLRERKEDIPLFADHFLHFFGRRYGKAPQRFLEECVEMLMAYPWPGNIRELRNVVERCVVSCPEDVISPGYLSKEVRQKKERHSITIPLGSSTREAERRLILETLASVNSNKSRAARILGLSRKTLQNKLHAFEEVVEESPAKDGERGLPRGIRTPADR